MKKQLILEIFDLLKEKRITENESEFSEHWLGHSEGYMRKLRSTQSEPSLGAVAICASRLQNASDQFSRVPRYVDLSKKLKALGSKPNHPIDSTLGC